MPTPMPIIDASCVVMSGVVNTWLDSATSAKPTPMPNIAVRIGSPIASSEPNAMSRMITAAAMPISSEAPSSGLSWNIRPPNSTCSFSPATSVPLAVRTILRTSSIVDCFTSLARCANCTVANATLPSFAVCPRPCAAYGLVMPVMPGTFTTSAKRCSIAACTSGVATPAGDANTICPSSPALAAKRALRRLAACCDSVPPTSMPCE